MGILDDVDNGSISSVFAIASADFKESHSGGYVVPYAKIGKPSKNATKADLALRLWEWTEAQLKRKGLL
jgi:hypothetical protein